MHYPARRLGKLISVSSAELHESKKVWPGGKWCGEGGEDGEGGAS